MCESCKAVVSFSKDAKGRIDNRKYIAFNRANFVQPFGRTGNLYRRLYGTPKREHFEYTPASVAKRKAWDGWDETKRASEDIMRERRYV